MALVWNRLGIDVTHHISNVMSGVECLAAKLCNFYYIYRVFHDFRT